MLRNTLLFVVLMDSLGGCTNHKAASAEQTDSVQTAAVVLTDVPASLQGKWQLTSDPNQVMEIHDTAITDYYEGKKQLSRTFAYVAACNDTGCINGKSSYGHFTTAGQFDIDCRTIVKLSATQLDITLGSSTSEIAHYKKLP